MFDMLEEIAAIHRAVAVDSTADVVSVTVARTYDADADDVWDALTSPERLPRWFYPVTGDLVVGGSFQLEGNAGGDVLACERPTLLRVTFGGPQSVVEVRLAETPAATTVELTHTVPLAMAGSGAGALFVGPGWDGALVALARHLRGELTGDPLAAADAPEMIRFNRESVDRWTAVVERSGTAGDAEVAGAREMALAQYTTVPTAEG
ncbi:SRPBCC domain-containing protein [Actinotalea solisilvae]|uniref:SRPBCC domain-containing protein n=1 Tax=Actinotalea solisilvae TaxID=2072922 RepID=UPI0018F1E610|nr:SRPBCC domain-containing protein [Actinotalea solisilvae]